MPSTDLRKNNKTDHRDTQIWTEVFNEEPISALNFKIREEQPKIFKQPTLICPVTLQESPNDRGFIRADWTPVPMLELSKFKKVIISFGMDSSFMKQS